MKKKINPVILAALLAASSGSAPAAEIMEEITVVPAARQTAAAAATAVRTAAPAATAVKPAAAAVRTQAPNDDTVKKMEEMASEIRDIKSRLDALNTLQSSLRDSIRILEEKSLEYSAAAAGIKLYSRDLEAITQKSDEDRKKTRELEKAFTEMNDILKQRVDKMRGWDDILDVLKKEISNNEREIARLKKEINSLKKQYGGEEDNIWNAIVQWPYAGVTALVISIAAFITVMAVK